MNSMTKTATLVALALSTTAFADEGFRQHEAHVHGHVELNIAQDGKELLMEITAPGADVVGFEHAPKTAEQEKALKEAVTRLEKADSIFTLASAAGCKVEHQSVTHTLGADDHDHDHDHDHEKHDGHHDEHKHHDSHDEHHNEHEGHEHHDEHKGGHGEFTVEYHFECDDINALSSIDTQWFNAFPTTESISVNLLTDKVQTALELSSGNTKISF
ncbi:DUF2796 domain-containing protein [Vibrio sp. Isolate23]|uniref:zinc uptake protein ZrgA n=1 Tax=Vibrio sp. Isolate23 TaxID=2908533 RepID=UPI001EFC697C|nr:DUF2796 domain-containing protein [Vibrio sp. Isolate23]MCG9680961.1 DUF2796 domain-containing protein [Vibrio sp. Isolate23]